MTVTFDTHQLDVEERSPGSIALVRLFRHQYLGSEWDEPSVPIRKGTGRVDPPAGYLGEYTVLYTADWLPAAVAECNILKTDGHDSTWNSTLAADYSVVHYSFTLPAAFIQLDGNNRDKLGLKHLFGRAGVERFHQVGLELHRKFALTVHGLSWQSYHRNQIGRVYAIWHDRKSDMGMSRPSPPFSRLLADAEWLQFLTDHPEVQEIH